MPNNRNRAIGFTLILLVAILLLWAGVTGKLADFIAAALAPVLLEAGN